MGRGAYCGSPCAAPERHPHGSQELERPVVALGSQPAGGGRAGALFALPLKPPAHPGQPFSSVLPPPACISVLSACTCQALWRPRWIVPAPRGLMGGVWVPLSALEPGNNGLHVFCTYYSPGPVLRDSPASINLKGTLAGALSPPFYRRREHTSSA